jgi:aspartate 1-decarboxylase
VLRTMLRAKIHRATVTSADVAYVGSITLDAELMAAADLLEGEQVAVLDVTNGARVETYVLAGAAGSGTVQVNGAAARLVHPGDLVIVLAYAHMDEAEARAHRARVVFVDRANRIVAPERARELAAAAGS